MHRLLLMCAAVVLSSLVFCIPNSKAQPATTGCHLVHHKIDIPPLNDRQKREIRASIERSDTFDVLHYDINLDVTNFQQNRIFGECRVQFTSKMDNIDYFSLDLLDLNIDSIMSEGRPISFNRTGFVIHMDLMDVMMTGDTQDVTVYYHGRPTVSQGSFGGFYFEGGYAYNLGIDLIGMPHNFGRSWFPCFDNFVERATYKIALTTNNGRKGYGTGEFLGEEIIQGDTVRRTYHMQQQLPTYLVGVAVSNYAEENYVHSGAFGDIPVQIVAKPQDLGNARNSLAFLPDAIDCLEYWYGPYVWNRVGYVMTLRGAMEHADNIAYPDNSIANGNLSTRLMTHELCHHWWGNLVTPKYAQDMWLKEGNAEYGAHLIEEYIGGHDPFRVTVRNNHHFVVTTAHLEDGDYLALSPLSHEDTYGRHTYYRGASMLHNLRAYLGDSLFRHGQRMVLENNAYSFLNAQTYRDALTAETGYDLTDFFDDWIFAPGYSDYYLHHANYKEDIYELTVHIGQNQYNSTHLHNNAPVPVTLFFENGETMDARVMISGKLDSGIIRPVPSEPVSIAINHGHIMNLGMFEDSKTVVEPDEFKDARANYQFEIESLTEPFTFAIENHLTAPEGIYDEEVFRLSSTHFWHLSHDADEGEVDGILFLYYDDNDELASDADLTGMSEDSIVVMYREDATKEWVVHHDYTQLKLIPTDGKGTMILRSFEPGDYTFANRLDGNVGVNMVQRTVSLEIFPNPTSDILNFDLPTESGDLAIYSIDGKLIEQIQNARSLMEVSVSHLPSGEYVLVYESNEFYGAEVFAIK